MFDTMHIKCVQTEKVLSAYYYIHKRKNVILQPFIMFSFLNPEISGPNSVAFVYVFWSYKVKKVSNKSYIICYMFSVLFWSSPI
jgi:hypothetical protein